LQVEDLGRGYPSLYTGTHDALVGATESVCTVKQPQDVAITSAEDVALSWISSTPMLYVC
jgi:hypothetical protein